MILTSDVRLGKKSSKVDFSKEFRMWSDWFFFETSKFRGETLVVAGNFFDTDYYVTVEQHENATAFFERAGKEFERVYLLVGKHDRTARRGLDRNLYRMLNLPENFEIVQAPACVLVEGVTVGLHPFGEYSSEHLGEANVVAGPLPRGVSPEVPTYCPRRDIGNGDGMLIPISFAFQVEKEDAGTRGGFVRVNNGLTTRHSWNRDLFRKVEIVDGKIDGTNPVKWITQNRASLEGTCLEVVVPHDVDKNLFQKFTGVLSSAKLADAVTEEILSFDDETKIDTEKFRHAGSMVTEFLSRPGAKAKIEKIAGGLK